MVNEQQKPSAQQQATQKRSEAKTLLSALRWTTTVGAVSLTLAGWGLLSRADALNAALSDQSAPAELAGSAAVALAASGSGSTASDAGTQLLINNTASTGSSTGGDTNAAAIAWPTATATAPPTATAAPTATPQPTATPAHVITLNVTQWVQDSAGNPWAVVQDNSGVLWYVWGPDVERIEQGLDPEVQPQPVNTTARSRGS